MPSKTPRISKPAKTKKTVQKKPVKSVKLNLRPQLPTKPKRKCVQCAYKKSDGQQCQLNTCRQFPYCWVHLRVVDGLQVKPSTVPGAGLGLFFVGNKRTDHVKARNPISCYSAKNVDTNASGTSDYIVKVGRSKFMNSEDKLNYVGRYINHSADPNVEISGTHNIRERMGRFVLNIRTKKRVNKGDELFLDYGPNFKNPTTTATHKKKKK